MPEGEHTLAVFIDFENLALGFKGKRDRRFEIRKVLERLVEKGKLIVKKAYADWADYAEYKKPLHEAAIELIEIPKRAMTGKNSADIRLCVDALDLCYSKEHIDTFVIVSGDSDFSPLVSKLKENGKRVIGLGIKDSSSNLLVDNCDEFIYYEDLERPLGIPPKIEQDLPEKKKEAFQLLVDSVVALVRENKEVLWSSMVKETMKRKKPSFNESYHGYRTFSDLLEDAEKEGIIQLRTDTRSGTYVIIGFGKEQKKEAAEELKGSKEQKERKPPKPRWRSRPRKPTPKTPPAPPEPLDIPNASETEPIV
ncbi:MAG TPA: NYN domain-containing protein [Thermodesulfobacteriota bacterium]|nr:NYN domain-containing protein [Thermodesulfobacteriota bacterium]